MTQMFPCAAFFGFLKNQFAGEKKQKKTTKKAEDIKKKKSLGVEQTA